MASSSSYQDDRITPAPPLPAKVDIEEHETVPAPALPPRPPVQTSSFGSPRSHHDGAAAPPLPERPRTGRSSPPDLQLQQLPPRRLLTTGDVPVNTVGYSRNPERVVAYLIPLPPPIRQGQVMKIPQRYLLYTPPAAHLLKPTGSKEGKRHKAKRWAQQEIKKAKTYTGKTASIRGLHSKTLRGVDWAVAAIKSTDITFMTRVPRHQVGEIVLIHPPTVLEHQSPDDVYREFSSQLTRTKRRAAKHSLISTALFAPAIVIDTLAVVIWPFGGLAEIDAVWMYTSYSGFLTARSVTKRLDKKPITADVRDRSARRLRRELRGSDREGEDMGPEEGHSQSSSQRRVHFEEDLDEEDLMKNGEGSKKPVKVRLVSDEAMSTMADYFHETCHKRNPRAFPSAGVPPTKTDVLASIGWWPDRRGRAPGVEREEDWDDENWQTQQAKEDLDKVFRKAAKQWDKWCRSYAKYPERAMKEKGHSVTSEVLRRLRIKKGTVTKQEPE